MGDVVFSTTLSICIIMRFSLSVNESEMAEDATEIVRGK